VRQMIRLIIPLLILTFAAPALAQQSSWDNTPGGQTGQQNLAPVLVQPFGTGWSVAPAGQPPVLVQPWGNNSYTIAKPGQPPAIVSPFGQGWIAYPPLNGWQPTP